MFGSPTASSRLTARLNCVLLVVSEPEATVSLVFTSSSVASKLNGYDPLVIVSDTSPKGVIAEQTWSAAPLTRTPLVFRIDTPIPATPVS